MPDAREQHTQSQIEKYGWHSFTDCPPGSRSMCKYARYCADGGLCHHGCAQNECFREEACEPLSGVFPNDEWPVTPGRRLYESEEQLQWSAQNNEPHPPWDKLDYETQQMWESTAASIEHLDL